MDMKTLVDRAVRDLPERLSEKIPGVIVAADWIRKTHDRSYYGISVRKPDADYGLCINPQDIVDHMQRFDYGLFLMELQYSIEQWIDKRPSMADLNVEDFDAVKDYLFPELVSAERDRELLGMLPHIVVEDLAIVFRLVLGDENVGVPVSSMITNVLLDSYQMTVEELYSHVCSSAPYHFPPQVALMGDILERFSQNTQSLPQPSLPMFVATCNGGYFGAGVIFYPGFLDRMAETLESDLLLLPSSVHEMIILPFIESLDVVHLKAVVEEVNDEIVEPMDRLTNSVYCYYRKEKHFCRLQDGE